MSVSLNLNSLLFTSEKPDCSQGMLGCFRPGPIPSIFWAEPYMMPAPSDKVHSLNKTKKNEKTHPIAQNPDLIGIGQRRTDGHVLL